MPSYLHPGVYVEEIPSGSKPIEGVATSVAAFVGYTVKGPLGEPTRINKWDDYASRFGGIRDLGQQAAGDPMGHAVAAFFRNGGTTAYIVRITKDWTDDLVKDATAAVGYLDYPLAGDTDHVLAFTAINEGVWGNGLVVQMAANATDSAAYDVEIGRKDADGVFSASESFFALSMDPNNPRYIKGVVNGASELVSVALLDADDVTLPTDSFLGTSVSGDLTGASLDFTAASEVDRTLEVALDGQPPLNVVLEAVDYSGDLSALAARIQAQVRGASAAERRANFTCVVEGTALVLTSGSRKPESAVVVSPAVGPAAILLLGETNGGTEITGEQTASTEATLAGGADGSQPGTADYQAVFTAFLKYRDINILCLPGQSWAANGSGNAVISSAIAHAEKTKSRVVIVDPPVDEEFTTEKQVSDMRLPTSTYSALYYPWIKASNPYYSADSNPNAPKTVLVPPCGVAAGMWSKIDGRRGVWKAPAGVETGLLGVSGLQYTVEDAEQGVLNPLGVNCLRSLPNFGSVVWGARTLATKADPEWRYVPVRRTAIMIEQSIYNGIQWSVFEPNDHRLWSALRTNIDSFMNGLYRSGAFQGEKASDAYFVRCGLGDTMTQGDIDRGQVIVIVGFAPLKPAEFVIVRIQQKIGQQ
ncbi:MAG: phage tail sheath subtilisin-like domain-containing protein [Pseudomonadota bacterium]|nr:phage tail sheath subtilisin-like domain-containing protein [Pseudomonadota bacterium]